MLKSEIDANRPVIYGGVGTNGGHQFVLDGYNNNNQLKKRVKYMYIFIE